jgi:hypothetical protein
VKLSDHGSGHGAQLFRLLRHLHPLQPKPGKRAPEAAAQLNTLFVRILRQPSMILVNSFTSVGKVIFFS